MKELLRAVGISLIRNLIRFFSLVWVTFLSFGKEVSFAADDGVFLAAAGATAVALPVDLPPDVPDHEGGEDGDAGKVKHEHTNSCEEAETGQCFQR